MVTTKKIKFLICAFIAVLFMSSCESDDREIDSPDQLVETTDQLVETTIPISIEELEDKSSETLFSDTDEALRDNIPTWGTVEGAYFERQENSVLEYPNEGSAITTFSIWFEDVKFTYIRNVSNDQLIALPMWSANNMAFAYIQDIETKTWKPYKEVRYAVQQSDDFSIEFSGLSDTNAVVEWDRTAFADFRYDIFLQGEKIKENLSDRRALYVFRKLQPDTFYAAKIVAKANDGSLRIRYISFRTPKTITISNFDVTLSNITTNSLSISWTAPTITNTSELEYRVVVGSKEFFTKDTSMKINDIEPISIDIDVVIEAIAGNKLYSVRQAKHADFRLSGQPVEDNSVEFYVYQDFDVPDPMSMVGLEWTPPSAPDGKDFHCVIYVNEKFFAKRSGDSEGIGLNLYNDVNLGDEVSVQAIFANGTSATSSLFVIEKPPFLTN